MLQAAVGQLLDLFTINAPTAKVTRDLIQIAAEVMASATAPELQAWAAELSDHVVLWISIFLRCDRNVIWGISVPATVFSNGTRAFLPNLKNYSRR